MVYGFENENTGLAQIKDLCGSGEYTGEMPEKTVSVPASEDTVDAGRNMKRAAVRKAAEERNRAAMKLLGEVKAGDVVITSSILNFSGPSLRTPWAGFRTALAFMEKGVRVISVLEKFDSNGLDLESAKRISRLLAYSMELSSSILSPKRREGIARAAREGRSGRRGYALSDYPEFDALYEQYHEGKTTKKKIAEELGISLPTLDRFFRMKEEGEKDADKE